MTNQRVKKVFKQRDFLFKKIKNSWILAAFKFASGKKTNIVTHYKINQNIV